VLISSTFSLLLGGTVRMLSVLNRSWDCGTGFETSTGYMDAGLSADFVVL